MFDIFRRLNFSLQSSKNKPITKDEITCCIKCNCIFVKDSSPTTDSICDDCHSAIVSNRLKQLGML